MTPNLRQSASDNWIVEVWTSKRAIIKLLLGDFLVFITILAILWAAHALMVYFLDPRQLELAETIHVGTQFAAMTWMSGIMLVEIGLHTISHVRSHSSPGKDST